MYKQRHQRHFNLRRERMAQIDHRVLPATGEIIGHCSVLKLPIFDSNSYAFLGLDDSWITHKSLLADLRLSPPESVLALCVDEKNQFSTVADA